MVMSSIKILSIDDDEAIRYALKAIFDYEKWESHFAADVESGVEVFKKSQPDIVLIDYHMPKINGITGVRMLRKLSSDVPIIVFTIDESQEVANSFLEAGATDFALKPIKAPDLISRIYLHKRLLDSSRALKAAQPAFPKGIQPATLELVQAFLGEQEEVVIVEQIARGTGLAVQTTYRYLQYLLAQGIIDKHVVYGKVGRPKQGYSVKK